MRFMFFITSFAFISSSQAAAPKQCQDIESLVYAAQYTIETYMNSDVDESISDYIMLSGDPEIDKANTKGKDLWSVPVVVDGEGCYGTVFITTKTGTCEIVGEPSFDGVSCTDD